MSLTTCLSLETPLHLLRRGSHLLLTLLFPCYAACPTHAHRPSTFGVVYNNLMCLNNPLVGSDHQGQQRPIVHRNDSLHSFQSQFWNDGIYNAPTQNYRFSLVDSQHPPTLNTYVVTRN